MNEILREFLVGYFPKYLNMRQNRHGNNKEKDKWQENIFVKAKEATGF